MSINAALGCSLTALSSAARPAGWVGDWVQLADDAGALPDDELTAGGALHYVPEHHPGLRTRMAQLSAWIDAAEPEAMIVDVSVEVALLARLHGVPVVAIALPGRRDDRAHQLGYDIARAIVAPWPAAAGSIWPAATTDQLARTEFVGAISRFPVLGRPEGIARRVVVLNGTGGGGAGAAEVAAARAACPDWEWVHLDRASGTWVDDPWPLIRSAAVVVTHTGQNALAEIAAARTPAILIPQQRPFDEQLTTARALLDLGGLPVLVSDQWPAATAWPRLLSQAARLDGRGWSVWNDGFGATRAADLIRRVADRDRVLL